MRRLLLVLLVPLLLFAAWQAMMWHRHAVMMARLEGKALGLDQCREIVVTSKGGK